MTFKLWPKGRDQARLRMELFSEPVAQKSYTDKKRNLLTAIVFTLHKLVMMGFIQSEGHSGSVNNTQIKREWISLRNVFFSVFYYLPSFQSQCSPQPSAAKTLHNDQCPNQGTRKMSCHKEGEVLANYRRTAAVRHMLISRHRNKSAIGLFNSSLRVVDNPANPSLNLRHCGPSPMRALTPRSTIESRTCSLGRACTVFCDLQRRINVVEADTRRK
jgi:hypothetical protein